MLSIIIPNRNHGEYLRECVLSAWRSGVEMEFVIIEDGSDDNSLQVIFELQKKSIPIHLIRHDRPEGVIKGMNEGLRAAKGEYVLFRAADDLSVTDGIGPALDLLRQYPESGLVCGDMGYFRDRPDCASVEKLLPSENPCFVDPDELVDALGNNPIFAHTVIFRRLALLEVGFFRSTHEFYSDWFITHAVAFGRGICYLPTCLALARLSPASYANAGSRSDAKRDSAVRSLRLSVSQLEPAVQKRFERSRAFEFFESYQAGPGRREAARNELVGMAGVIGARLLSYLPNLRHRCEVGKVVWYGVGKHSDILWDRWIRLGLRLPDRIWVSDNCEGNRTWRGIPVVVVPDKLTDEKPLLVVLSSKSYEPDMYDTVKGLGVCSILSFWGCQTHGLSRSITQDERSELL